MSEQQASLKPDDFNRYLTWGNMLKVVIFLCTPIGLLSSYMSKSTVQDIELKTIAADVRDMKTTMKEFKEAVELSTKESNSRVTVLEQQVELLKVELRVIKENQTKR